MNWGKAFSWAMAAMSFAASVGYFVAKNPRMGIYWFLAGLIAADLAY